MDAADDLSSVAADEFGATLLRFEAVASRWALDVGQAAALLGMDRGARERVSDLVPATADAEARMRLAIDVDGLLVRIVGDEELADWLREPNDAFVGCRSPLAAMSLGAYSLRALRNVLADVASGSRA